MYRILTAAQFRRDLSQSLLQVRQAGQRLLITRNGHDVAGLVSVADLDRLETVDKHSEEMMQARHMRMMEEFRRLKDTRG